MVLSCPFLSFTVTVFEMRFLVCNSLIGNITACAPSRSSIRKTVPLISSRLRSEEHTSELQSRPHLVCRLLLEIKKEPRVVGFPCRHLLAAVLFYRGCCDPHPSTLFPYTTLFRSCPFLSFTVTVFEMRFLVCNSLIGNITACAPSRSSIRKTVPLISSRLK